MPNFNTLPTEIISEIFKNMDNRGYKVLTKLVSRDLTTKAMIAHESISDLDIFIMPSASWQLFKQNQRFHKALPLLEESKNIHKLLDIRNLERLVTDADSFFELTDKFRDNFFNLIQ